MSRSVVRPHEAEPLSAIKDVEIFPKASVTKAFIEREKAKRMSAGAIICEITENDKQWVLTTVWPD